MKPMKSMNPRERVLALAVGGLLILVIGFFIQSWIANQFNARHGQIADLRNKLKRAQSDALAGERAKRAIAEFQSRSLPADPAEARNRYHHWLLGEAQRHLHEPSVSPGSVVPERDLFVKLSFTVSGKATLPQTVDLLHSFYSVNWLHRVKSLDIKPLEDSKLLDVKLQVEALSLNGATGGQEPGISNRLELASREEYHEAIVNRNLFGPPNRAPSIRVSGSRDANIGRPAELTVSGTDPDPHDKLTYRLVASDASDAVLDPATGRFRWTPRATGRYEFTFEAADDGYPSLTSRQERVSINVTPPRPVVTQPPPPTFDFARYTVLAGVLESGGIGEVWLHVRPTDEMLKLHVGDQFHVGNVQGKVADIGLADFTFESAGKLRKLAKGEFLDQARVTGDAPQAAEASEEATEVKPVEETVPVVQQSEAE